MKRKIFYLLFIYILLFGTFVNCSNGKNTNQYSLKYQNKYQRLERIDQHTKDSHSPFDNILDINQLSELLSTIYLVIQSALCDKSFFITIVLFSNFEWSIVMLSSFLSITVIQFISIYENFGQMPFKLQEWIDIIAVCFFNIYGIFYILEGLKQNQFDNQLIMQEIQKEINKSLTIEETMIEIENSNINKSEKKESALFWEKIKIILLCLISIFLSETGDKTQFSTIYVTLDSSKILIFASFIIAHLLLIIISIGIAFGLNRIASKNAIRIISGATFIYFAIICAHLIYVNNYLITNKSHVVVSEVLNKKNKLNFIRKI